MTEPRAALSAFNDLLARLPQGIAPKMVRFALGNEFTDAEIERAIQDGVDDGSILVGARGLLVKESA